LRLGRVDLLADFPDLVASLTAAQLLGPAEDDGALLFEPIAGCSSGGHGEGF